MAERGGQGAYAPGRQQGIALKLLSYNCTVLTTVRTVFLTNIPRVKTVKTVLTGEQFVKTY